MSCVHTVDVKLQSIQLAINRTYKFSNWFSWSVRIKAETDTAFSSPNAWIVDVEGGFCAPTTDLFRDITIDFKIITRITIGIAGYGYSTCRAFIVKIRSLRRNLRMNNPEEVRKWKWGSSFDNPMKRRWMNDKCPHHYVWLMTYDSSREMRWLKRKTETLTPHPQRTLHFLSSYTVMCNE